MSLKYFYNTKKNPRNLTELELEWIQNIESLKNWDGNGEVLFANCHIRIVLNMNMNVSQWGSKHYFLHGTPQWAFKH